MKERDQQGGPQFWRRFKAGIVYVRGSLKGKEIFLGKYVNDGRLRARLREMCDNYGELHDYLEPALREADKQGKPLTDELFCLIYDIPDERYVQEAMEE